MLNEDNVFGDVCMDDGEVRQAVIRNYGQEQSEENRSRYSRIVEFHDGHNADRIIGMLKKDGLLS